MHEDFRNFRRKFRRNFLKITIEEYLLVKEQISAPKARNYLKQYFLPEPYKFFLRKISGSNVITSSFILNKKYKCNNKDELNLRVLFNVFFYLSKKIQQNFKLYFDN